MSLPPPCLRPLEPSIAAVHYVPTTDFQHWAPLAQHRSLWYIHHQDTAETQQWPLTTDSCNFESCHWTIFIPFHIFFIDVARDWLCHRNIMQHWFKGLAKVHYICRTSHQPNLKTEQWNHSFPPNLKDPCFLGAGFAIPLAMQKAGNVPHHLHQRQVSLSSFPKAGTETLPERFCPFWNPSSIASSHLPCFVVSLMGEIFLTWPDMLFFLMLLAITLLVSWLLFYIIPNGCAPFSNMFVMTNLD